MDKNKKVKTSWLIDSKKNQTDDERLYSQIRSILNKLSGSNFNELAEEFIHMDILHTDHMMALVDIIFKKAIGELKYNDIYAKLCFELASYYIEEVSTDSEGQVDEEKGAKNKVYFRELLLNKCQQMFEQCVNSGSDSSEGDDTFKSKDKIIGCIKFVGELYNVNMLTNKVIYSCFLILLSKVNIGKQYSVDCLCMLMNTAGKKFDSTAENESAFLYDKIDKLIKSDKIEKKDMFALMDLVDLRKTRSKK